MQKSKGDYTYQPELVCHFLGDGTLRYTDETFDRYFENEGQQYILDFMPFVRRGMNEDLQGRLGIESGKPLEFHLEHKVVIKNKEERWLHWVINGTQSSADNPVIFKAFGRDITNIRNLELQEKRLLLEQERSQLLQQLIVDVSHDFRTPLSIINTSLYILMRSEDAETRNHYRRVIELQVTKITKLIDDLLTITALDYSTNFTFKPVNLNHLVRDVVSVHRVVAEEHHVQIDYVPPSYSIEISADKVNLGQALTRIVENAIQYSSQGGTIRIRIYEIGVQAVVEVKDTGIGIEASELARIFERLYKGNAARTSGEGGSGLGLPIANAIIEKHGGKIEVESTPTVGSTFRIYLPSGA